MAKVVVLGGGESGVGAAVLAKTKGYEVFLSDAGQIKVQYEQLLKKFEIPFEAGGHTEESFFDADIIVKSPGIPPWVSLIKMLRDMGKTIISELEWGYRFTEAPIIAVTGSNGKTTTASLIHHLLSEGGVEASLGGNIGDSFAFQVAHKPIPEVYVLEVSSFQLEDIQSFRPQVGILLNITPDHLDRYEGKMQLYGGAKFQLTRFQQAKDKWILNADDEWTQKLVPKYKSKAQLRRFGWSESYDGFKRGDRIVAGGYEFSLENVRLLGPHNQMNIMAAILAVQDWGLSNRTIQQGLETFDPIPHRLEPVGEMEGVTFINDSKATNVDAVFYALQAMDRPTIWLAGGFDKGNDYQPLKKWVEEKVKSIIVLGQHDEKFKTNFQKPVYQVENMEEAIDLAQELSESGDAVLLSPACASFDLFRNYEDRGDQFRAEVKKKLTE